MPSTRTMPVQLRSPAAPAAAAAPAAPAAAAAAAAGPSVSRREPAAAPPVEGSLRTTTRPTLNGRENHCMTVGPRGRGRSLGMATTNRVHASVAPIFVHSERESFSVLRSSRRCQSPLYLVAPTQQGAAPALSISIARSHHRRLQSHHNRRQQLS